VKLLLKLTLNLKHFWVLKLKKIKSQLKKKQTEDKEKHKEKKDEHGPVVLHNSRAQVTAIKLANVTHYEGKRVLVRGWILNFRETSKKTLSFFELRDGTGFIQVVFAGDLSVIAHEKELRRECSVAVWGTLTRPPPTNTAKWSGLELQADYWELIGHSPIDLEEKLNLDSNPEVMFDQRHIVVRGEKTSNYLKLRSIALQCFREHSFLKVISK